MTKDDIIRMAEEAGLEWIRGLSGAGYHINHTDALERFAALVAAEMKKRADQEAAMQEHVFADRMEAAITAEREACEKVADDADDMGSINLKLLKRRIRDAIRARGST